MNLYPTESVEEESSDSCEEEEDQEPLDSQSSLEFNPKNFYWVFNPELNFSTRPGFSIEDDINPNDFMEMRRINRKILTQFFLDKQFSKADERKIKDFDFGGPRDNQHSPDYGELKFE